MNVTVKSEYQAHMLLARLFRDGVFRTESQVAAMYVKGLLQIAGIKSAMSNDREIYTIVVSESIGIFLDGLLESLRRYD